MKRSSPRYTRAPTQEPYYDTQHLRTDRENHSASTSPRTSRPLPGNSDQASRPLPGNSDTRRNASCYHDTSPTSPSRPLPSNPYSYCRQRSNPNTLSVDDITPEYGSALNRAMTPNEDERTFNSSPNYHDNAPTNNYQGNNSASNNSYRSDGNSYHYNGNSSNHGKNPLSSRSYSPSYYSDQPIETEPHVRRSLSPNPNDVRRSPRSMRNPDGGRLSPNPNVSEGRRSPRRSPKGRRSPRGRDLPDLPQSPEVYSDEVEELAVKIEESMQETTKIMERVLKLQDFLKQNNVKSGDKNYIYLDEMLTRCLLELDNVQTHGVDEVRKYRKDVVGKVQEVVATLETIKQTGANPLVMYDPAVRGEVLPMTRLSITDRNNKE